MKNRLFIKKLCVSSVLLALSVVLSFVKLWDMPMGGSVTLVSMLPILLVGLVNGYSWGLGTSFVFAFFQLCQALASGDVFVWCETGLAVALCVLFDYLLPFSLLGLSAFAKPSKEKRLSVLKVTLTFGVLAFARFVCHYVTGVVIWGQWAENMSKYLYSFLYNFGYMGPEMALTMIAVSLLLTSKTVRNLIENQ